MTIQQIQQQINKKTNDPRQLINMIADYLQANPGGGSSSYLVYTALLNQTGTNAPVPTILENTLGFVPVWEYANVGQYNLNFPQDSLPEGVSAIFFTTSVITNTQVMAAFQDSADTVKVFTKNNGSGVNGYLYNITIEIRVYP